MGQLIVGQQVAVAVINTSPASLNGPLSHNLHLKGVKIFLPVYNLQIKNPVDQNPPCADQYHNDNKCPGGNGFY